MGEMAERSVDAGPDIPASRGDDTESLRLVVRQASARSVWRGSGRFVRKLGEDRVLGMSAEAGFWQLISLPSLLLGVFGSVGYLGGVLGHEAIVRIHDDVLRVAGDVLARETVTNDVAPLLDDILGRGHAAILSVGFLISLWSGSTAMSAYLNTITVAYGMRGVRSAVRSRVVALGLYLLAVVAGIVLLPALVLGPRALTELAPTSARADVSQVVQAAYFPGIALASVLVVATLYRLCLPERVRWRRHLPGAVLATLIWLAGSVAVRGYATAKLHSVSYGALAAPLAALLFFYIIALAVLLGAELNAVLRRPRATLSTVAAGPTTDTPAR